MTTWFTRPGFCPPARVGIVERVVTRGTAHILFLFLLLLLCHICERQLTRLSHQTVGDTFQYYAVRELTSRGGEEMEFPIVHGSLVFNQP